MRVLSPPRWAAETCWDKLAAARWLEDAGIAAPRVIPFERSAWEPTGLIVKPRRGVGSVGIDRVTDPADWARWCARSDLDEWIAQDLIGQLERWRRRVRGRAAIRGERRRHAVRRGDLEE